jgi:hypothetical protein
MVRGMNTKRDCDASTDETIEATSFGITFADWLAAAGRPVGDVASEYDLRAAWRAGELPEDYRL